MSQDLKRIIEQISRDKGLDKSVLIDTMLEAIGQAAKRKYGLSDNFEVTFNDDSGEFEVFRFHEVVEEVTDPKTQLSLKDARKLDPDSSLGDELGVKLETKDFGRIAAQSAKQVVIQRMKDAERRIVYDEFKDRFGKIVTGIIQRVEKGNNIIVNLGRAEALLPVSEQIPRETYYHRGERIKALVIDVRPDSRGPQVVLSRTHPDFLAALFEAEVPEISEGIVKIVGVAREAGSRSKIAVTTSDGEIDPVGACVGVRGTRVQAVVQELKGEKIDIIPYNRDIAHYVASSLAPAAALRVVVDEEARSLEVVVPDDQLSLAIGRKGQNVRLASRLVGWRIDVKNESKYQRGLKDGYQSLLRLPGVSETVADQFFEAGYGSARDLLEVSPDQLAMVEGMTEEKAEQIWNAAREYVDQLAREDAEEARQEALAKDFFSHKGAPAGGDDSDLAIEAPSDAAGEDSGEASAADSLEDSPPPDDSASAEGDGVEVDGEDSADEVDSGDDAEDEDDDDEDEEDDDDEDADEDEDDDAPAGRGARGGQEAAFPKKEG
ncbi:MAG: transcription termination factor NusA [Deltaproteobacteria bacterium]|jgi:N utilization substance protein A|nr:transcription termination factor NusA [Deltaproteobacteria bacterium]